MVSLRFQHGTLEVVGFDKFDTRLPSYLLWDERSECHRTEAQHYADLVLALRREKIDYDDQARRYNELASGLLVRREPRPFQSEAVAAWWRARGRGVVVLPTGAGKSYVAMLAMDKVKRSTLVIAPTLDLVRQWYDNLRVAFGTTIGVIGGGEHRVENITVSTYDSAYLHMEHIGARFGLLIFDEAHHLPSETYALAARLSVAPFRLGLTATPERQDGREALLDELIGPLCYRQEIVAMSGDYLAEYETQRVDIELSVEERAQYEEARQVYRDYLQSQGIRLTSPAAFADFMTRSSRTAEGRAAIAAYRAQKQLAFCAPAKLDYVEHLLSVHAADRAILFTQDNATAYAISRKFLIPIITHHTKVTERSHILQGFSEGTYRAIATSKVLNEGVDVPDANVAIVVSGSGSVREHVQRLGRVLRKKEGKRAILYELITARTGEAFTSERRRDHVAYQGS